MESDLGVRKWCCDIEGTRAKGHVAIPPEAITKAGTYIVTLKFEGESFPKSHRAHLVVGFRL
jgi:hypothetical protein